MSDGKFVVETTEFQRQKDLTFVFELPQLFGPPISQSKQIPWEALKVGELFPVAFDLSIWQRLQAELALRPVATLLKLTGVLLLLGLSVAVVRWLKSPRGLSEEKISHGDYNVLQELGRGAMGVVYLATDSGGKKLALKSILPEYAEDPEFAHRFEHEISACIELNHPHLVKYYGHGINSQGRPFSVTEFLDGRTLKDEIAAGLSQPHRTASDVLEQIGSALFYLHERKLVHRDVKPENIFVCRDGTMKLMDLGLVKGEAMTVLTRTGMVLGTPAYMAPEQFDGHTGPASDQYGLGIILYEILAGERPFTQPDMFALAYQHKTASPQPLSERDPRITQEINDAVLKMIAKKPSERFNNIEEIRQAISDKLLYLG
jgi:serine/threonine-protein kinase